MRPIVVAVALALAAACRDAPSDAAVEVVEVEGAPAVHEPVRAGDALVAVDAAFGAAPAQVLTSTDAGETWEPVRLPGATGPVWRLEPRALDGWATVVGRDDVENRPDGAVYVWTTTDARTWHGGRLAATAPSFVHADVHRFGDVLLASFTSERRLELHRSEDGGATWERAAALDLGIGDDQSAQLPRLWQEGGDELVGVGDFRGANPPLEGFVLSSSDGGRTWGDARRCAPLECPRPITAAGDLLLRGDEVSVDGGVTWARAEIEPDRASMTSPGSASTPSSATATGGWPPRRSTCRATSSTASCSRRTTARHGVTSRRIRASTTAGRDRTRASAVRSSSTMSRT